MQKLRGNRVVFNKDLTEIHFFIVKCSYDQSLGCISWSVGASKCYGDIVDNEMTPMVKTKNNTNT